MKLLNVKVLIFLNKMDPLSTLSAWERLLKTSNILVYHKYGRKSMTKELLTW